MAQHVLFSGATFVGENIFVGPLLLKHISSIVYS